MVRALVSWGVHRRWTPRGYHMIRKGCFGSGFQSSGLALCGCGRTRLWTGVGAWAAVRVHDPLRMDSPYALHIDHLRMIFGDCDIRLRGQRQDDSSEELEEAR